MDAIALDVLTTNTAQDFAIMALQDTTGDATIRLDSAEISITENAANITLNEGSIAEATEVIDAVSSTTSTHTSHLDELEVRVQQADDFLSFVTIDGMDNLVFSGTNILLNNGTGETRTPNGKGNLFLGLQRLRGRSSNRVPQPHHW